MNYFFVVGPPRCRTAWMANFLTHGPAFCWHDLTRECPSPRLLRNFFVRHAIEKPEFRFLGDSDSALLLSIPEMLDEFPDARWVLLRRDTKDCRKSWDEYFTADNPYPGAPTDPDHLNRVFDLLEEKLSEAQEILPAAKCARVAFEDLSHEATARHLWEWCLPGLRFPAERWRMLDTFRVNVLPKKLKGVS